MADIAKTPEVRMSPDGLAAPIRDVTGHPVLKWRMPDGLWLTDDEAATLMLRAQS